MKYLWFVGAAFAALHAGVVVFLIPNVWGGGLAVLDVVLAALLVGNGAVE